MAFFVPTMPQEGGSVPRPGYIPPPLLGELYLTVPMTWDLYQATVTFIAGVNPQTIYGNWGLVKAMMQRGDSLLAHLTAGPCFLMVRHQLPVPQQQSTSLQGLAHSGDSSFGGGATSIAGSMAACATAQNGQVTSGPGDVTIEVF